MPSGTTGPADAGSHDLRERLWALALSWRQFFGDPVSSHSIGARRTGFGCAEDLEALLKETAAASASAPAARPHFRCSEGCGVVAVDEDGCCRTCGADAVASAPAAPRETTKEEKADMSPGNPASDGDERPPSTPEARAIARRIVERIVSETLDYRGRVHFKSGWAERIIEQELSK
jgi:hypothetical protein